MSKAPALLIFYAFSAFFLLFGCKVTKFFLKFATEKEKSEI